MSASSASQSRWLPNLDSAFPPFIPGAPLKSVYERAGFEVNKATSPTSPTYAESIKSNRSSSSRKKSGSALSIRSNNERSSSRSSSALSTRNPTPISLQPTIIEDVNDHEVEDDTLKPESVPVAPPIEREPSPTPTLATETKEIRHASNSSSIYSSGHDPIQDGSPRIDRTRSLLPYQREQLSTSSSQPPQFRSLDETLDLAANSQAIATAVRPPPLNIKPPAQYHPPSPPQPLDLSPTVPRFPTSIDEQISRAAVTPTASDWQQQQQQQNHSVSRTESSASSRHSEDSSLGPKTPDASNALTPTTAIAPVIYKDGEYHKTETVQKKRKPKKGPCRGCGLPIVGKSVSSQDEQLSGRWHKQCFCCSGCGTRDFQNSTHDSALTNSNEGSAPIAEFYILHNNPLCHACYHTKNNSLCRLCGLGIEGTCLDDGISRYHFKCLRCSDCNVKLDPSAGFVSVIDGVFYCAKHAELEARRRQRTQSKNSTLEPVGEQGEDEIKVIEKRRTQILMM